MKKFVCTAILTFIGVHVFAQEKIAVFPFQDMDNVLTRNQAFVFYSDFTNEFANRSRGKFSVVPRQDVDRLIETEADFQLSNFSAREKTAEMMRVQNATQILSGSIIRLDNNIRISVSLYTYPELVQLPGGTNLSVANTTELFNKIPELVQKMLNEITPRPQPTPSPQRPSRPSIRLPEIFDDYTIYNQLAIFGYTYSFDTPLGFTFGFFGVYTSIGFALPDWEGIYQSDYTYDSSGSYTDRRYEIIDWVIGYNVTIIPKMLYLPVGFGTEGTREWRLDNYWHPAPEWENKFLFEVGLLFRPTNKIEFDWFNKDRTFSPYIFGTYRNIGFDKHSFSIGGGVSFEEQ